MSDGLCMSGPTFTRCSLPSLFYASGSPGEYQIHLRPQTASSRDLCLSVPKCGAKDFEKGQQVKLTKCNHPCAR